MTATDEWVLFEHEVAVARTRQPSGRVLKSAVGRTRIVSRDPQKSKARFEAVMRVAEQSGLLRTKRRVCQPPRSESAGAFYHGIKRERQDFARRGRWRTQRRPAYCGSEFLVPARRAC